MNEWKCPKCKKTVTCHPGTSRRDNKTEICSECCTDEAIFDWQVAVAKQKKKIFPQNFIDLEREWLKEVEIHEN